MIISSLSVTVDFSLACIHILHMYCICLLITSNVLVLSLALNTAKEKLYYSTYQMRARGHDSPCYMLCPPAICTRHGHPPSLQSNQPSTKSYSHLFICTEQLSSVQGYSSTVYRGEATHVQSTVICIGYSSNVYRTQHSSTYDTTVICMSTAVIRKGQSSNWFST